VFVCSQLQHTYSAVFLLPVTAASDLLVHKILLWLGYPTVKKFRRHLYSFDTTHERDRHTDRQTDGQTPHDGIGRAYTSHRAAKRRTSIVKRNLTKVDCSDNWGNIYVPRPGRTGPVFHLAAAALVYFATIALRGTQPL